MPFLWQSTQVSPRWRCTSPAMAWDGTPTSLTAWQARQLALFGRPTSNTQRPFASNWRRS